MEWPNFDDWKALSDGAGYDRSGKLAPLRVVDCGELVANHGRLVVCDPIFYLEPNGNPFIPIPPGRYPVKVTVADVSAAGDGSHLRNAYASLLLSLKPEVRRRVITPVSEGEESPEMEDGEFIGFWVDAAIAGFLDEGALSTGMPVSDNWYTDVFDRDDETNWHRRLEDPGHIRRGLANVPLPLATDGSNVVLFSSGWGDGTYPVVGGYDADGNLVRVHIDFLVIGPPDDDDESGAKSPDD